MRGFLGIALVVIGLAALGVWAAGRGILGSHEAPGEITARAVPAEVVQDRVQTQQRSAARAGAPTDKQVLFGDLHVHTTFSADAYLLSLPALQGEGAHPPADACDFARFCSALDFWSINDHAEALTARHWEETVESIRQCNAVTSPTDPDVVAFLGWEWTQVGTTRDNHYGHKNVVLAHTEDERIPARPIASRGLSANALGGPSVLARAYLALSQGGGRYLDFATYVQERNDRELCPEGVPVRDLPADCLEATEDPAELFAKLRDWGHDAIVIPHGTTWGFYTPAGSSWDKQLVGAQHDPELQTLIEVYSGHGNSEEYRPYLSTTDGPDGEQICPGPQPDYVPSCWKAGELIRERCLAAGLDANVCEERAVTTRAYYLEGVQAGHLSVPGASAEDWLDSGQCRDCFLPSFNHRPKSSAQYIAAIGNFDDPKAPRRFRFGFMASSDNHKARPGTGYKERDRQEMTEASGPGDADVAFLRAPNDEPAPEPARAIEVAQNIQGFQRLEAERQASFFTTGGLIATHSTGRDRGAIWDAMKRREVYGTSGPRILLWFDLLNGAGGPLPMGSETRMTKSPVFQVKAIGSFEQKPGCPDHATSALSADRLQRICLGECYHPSDRRRKIQRIEVVRIRPQNRAGEDVSTLIEDPWKVLTCTGNPAGCVVRFEDPDYHLAGRNTVYYARAIEEPSPVINAGNLRCERDADGNCVSLDPCYGDFRTPYEDDCLESAQQRAWSSPIYVDYGS